MSRRKLKSSTLSIFRWFCKNIAIVLGIIPQTRRCRRTLTKRCNRRVNILLPNKNIKSQLRQIDMLNRDKNTAEFIHVCIERVNRLLDSGSCIKRWIDNLFSYSYHYSIITIIVVWII
jgi:hypothetical protein